LLAGRLCFAKKYDKTMPMRQNTGKFDGANGR